MSSKIEKDIQTITFMITLYCRHKEGNKSLCPSCKALQEYAIARLTNCKFGAEKPACKNCPIHCYRPDMRQAIQKVMRYSGPRMIYLAPWTAIKHLIFKK